MWYGSTNVGIRMSLQRPDLRDIIVVESTFGEHFPGSGNGYFDIDLLDRLLCAILSTSM